MGRHGDALELLVGSHRFEGSARVPPLLFAEAWRRRRVAQWQGQCRRDAWRSAKWPGLACAPASGRELGLGDHLA